MKNPFLKDHRYKFEIAYRYIPIDLDSILDFGCGDGFFLSKIANKAPKATLFGFDVDKSKVEMTKKQVKAVKIVNLEKSGKLLLKRESLDVVCLLDVLEHVPSEDEVLDEIYRVLKPGGKLLLSVPHKGLAEIFDSGNIKFRAPWLHKFLYKIVFRQKGYEKIYQGGKMVGDVSVQENMWHKHYSCSELEKLLSGRYKIIKAKHYALFFPILSMLDQAYSWFFAKSSRTLKKLVLKDSRTSLGRLSYSIFVYAIKV